jgi:hypothetical protein
VICFLGEYIKDSMYVPPLPCDVDELKRRRVLNSVQKSYVILYHNESIGIVGSTFLPIRRLGS